MNEKFENRFGDDERSEVDKGIKFEKGNASELPPVLKTEKPISKEETSDAIREFIYKVFPNDAETLRHSEFETEFLCFGARNGFITINLKSEEPKKIEVRLQGVLLEEFVRLLIDSKFGDAGNDHTPSEN